MIVRAPVVDPIRMLRPGRQVHGMSAVLLPYHDNGSIDWDGFVAHLLRTRQAGLVPAVNMDTGYANLLDAATREKVLQHTRAVVAETGFVAGVFVADAPGAPLRLDSYLRELAQVLAYGGMPIIFQSHGLTSQDENGILAAYAAIARETDYFLAFELGQMFAPFGRIYSLEAYQALMAIPQCVGAKHSSLSRELEWQRLALRDDHRPDFKVLTGNDLAIDMVMYGSDYLLGLSTFAPDLFAKRDALWAAEDPGFYALNDVLQYLGHFAFRAPVPAYKHSAAQFLKLRGWLNNDAPHPQAQWRPSSDLGVLAAMLQRMRPWLDTDEL